MVITQEMEIKGLREENAVLKESKRKCERNRKREGRFLESVITQCKGDNVPLTDQRCTDFCRENKVKVPLCKALCETRAPPCTYWHRDTYKPPSVPPEELFNRTRRTSDELLNEHWMGRLRTYREIAENINDAVEAEDDENVTSDPWVNYFSDSQQAEYKVIAPDPTANCSNIACVNHENLADVACLDLGKIDLRPGSLIGNVRTKLLEPRGKGVFL